MRHLLVLALTAAALGAASPASAATWTGPAAAGCVQEVSAVSTGTVFAAGSCAGSVGVFRRDPGGGFRQVGAWPGDLRVLDVAADGAATFVVLARATAALSEDVLIGRLPHGGRPSALTRLGASEDTVRAAVTAAGSRWAAAWDETVRELDQPGSGSTTVQVRGTLLRPGRQDFPSTRASAPALARGDDGQLVLAFVDDSQPEPLQVARARTGGAFGAPQPVTANGGAPVGSPAVTVSGGTRVLAWSRSGRPAVAFDGGPRRDLPARGRVDDVRLAASGGSAFVTTAESFSTRGAQTTRVYARDVGSAGLRSTTELVARGVPAGTQQRLLGTTAARGRATVVTTGGVFDSR